MKNQLGESIPIRRSLVKYTFKPKLMRLEDGTFKRVRFTSYLEHQILSESTEIIDYGDEGFDIVHRKRWIEDYSEIKKKDGLIRICQETQQES
jgi:hypothetical protein